MKFILGTKQNMTQMWNDKGQAVPVTVLRAGPVVVTDVRTPERDGYRALQVGFGTKNATAVRKPQQHTFGKLGNFRFVREFRLWQESETVTHKVGDTIDVSVFAPGEQVDVSAITKGKGFQGVVKRHGFAGGSRTHGQKHSEREPGSIGGGGRAGGRVVKGMRMAGRMGGDRVTVRNLTVAAVDPQSGVLYLRGSVPGRRGTLVEVRAK